MPTPTTSAWQMADRLSGGTLANIIHEQRTAGVGWGRLAAQLYADHGIVVTDVTLADWYGRILADSDEQVTQTADPRPAPADGRSPAVTHAILTGRPELAAAVHVLDGIDSPLLPRGAVAMGGIDWEPIIDASMGMSSGERLMVGAARDLDRYGTVLPEYHDDLRARLDPDCLTRIADAILIARTSR